MMKRCCFLALCFVLPLPIQGKGLYSGIAKFGMIIPLTLNGETHNFIVDSGSNFHVVMPHLQHHLNGFRQTVSINTNFKNQELTQESYNGPDSISFVGTPITLSADFLVIDLGRMLDDIKSNNITGLLGAEFYNQFVWDINGTNDRFTIYDPDSPLPEMPSTDFIFACNFDALYKTPECGAQNKTAPIDTGDWGGWDLVVSASFFDHLKHQGMLAEIYSSVFFGIGSSHIVRVGLADGIEITSKAVTFFRKSSKRRATHWLPFIKVADGNHTHLTLYFLRRGYTRYNPVTKTLSFSRMMTPLVLIPLELGAYVNDQLVIEQISDGCTMTFSTIRAGDILTSINDQPIFSRMDIPNLSGEDLPIEIEVLRGDERLREKIFFGRKECRPVANCMKWLKLSPDERKGRLFDYGNFLCR